MKKLLILTCFVFVFTNGKTQTYTYHPFPDSLGIWSSLCYDWTYTFTGMDDITFTLINDTMTDGYKKYYETNKRVFMKTESDSIYRLLIDFNLTVGDTFINPYYQSNDMPAGLASVYVQTDDTLGTNLGWPNRRCLGMSNGIVWVEGIGNVISWTGWYHNLSGGTISGGCIFECIFDDIVAFPCSNFGQAENELQRISIYPNPSEGHIFIRNISKPTEIKIFNSLGMFVQKREVLQDSELDLSHWPKGIYMFRLQRDGEVHAKRIVLN